MSDGALPRRSHFRLGPYSVTPTSSSLVGEVPLAEIEKEAIRRTLNQAAGRRTEAPKILGLSIRALERKIKKYALLL